MTDSDLGEDLLHTPSIRVFGLGGGGSNVTEKLRSQHRLGPHVSVRTINRIEEKRDSDLKFASGIRNPLSHTDYHLISKLIGRADCVILCAGLGGWTGTALIPHFAETAKERGTKVVAIVFLPFGWEAKRVRWARQAVAELAGIADRVITLSNDSLSKALPGSTPMGDYLAFSNGLAIQAILNAIQAVEAGLLLLNGGGGE